MFNLKKDIKYVERELTKLKKRLYGWSEAFSIDHNNGDLDRLERKFDKAIQDIHDYLKIEYSEHQKPKLIKIKNNKEIL